MKKLILLSLALVMLALSVESCSTHRKPKPPCKGGYWGGNNFNHRIN
jgi:hypothetical protein